jgi:TonB-dependent receptor-like protein/carboxypeptidase family protein
MKFIVWFFPMLAAAPVAAQTGGAIAGHVRDAATGAPLALARVVVGDGRQGAVSDTAGAYRIREVRSGWHRVRAEFIGYQPLRRDSVLVRAGQTTTIDFMLRPAALEVEDLVVIAPADPVLDPLMTADVQRITAEEIRRIPVTTLEEAVALSAGAVGESYRGGRLGQQAFIIDGLGVKNQLDASSGPLGLRIPPDLLTEASLVTNGFSARYGQALSGLINVVTKDGGDRWQGRAAYETDRPLWGTWDMGIDRAVLAADGPLPGGGGVAAVVDADARLDADPVNAPAPADPRDPRHDRPALLPHNRGERLDGALKVHLPLGRRHTLRLFGIRSTEQRLLFDPAYKYDLDLAPAQRVEGQLLSAHLQRIAGAVVADLRLGYFARDFVRGSLAQPADPTFGPFGGRAFEFVGEAIARAQDTAAARAAIPGLPPPELSVNTPWGVPAFFLGAGPRGEIAWNAFRDLRGQLDVSLAGSALADLHFGGEVSRQRVRTFQRVLSYLPVDSGVPPVSIADFRPLTAAAYAETQLRGEDFALVLGLRYDRFDPGTDLPGASTGRGARQSINPRFAFSTVLSGATFVASWGRFSQVPDFQYLVDAAFDDSTRTGRFRRGNPNLGFESATQYEFSLRARPSPGVSVRTNVFVKELSGLVASAPLGVDPDSTIFANNDYGTVRGVEVLFEREVLKGVGVRITYTLQQAKATATNAYQLTRRIRVDSITGDTIDPARVEFPLDYDRRHSLTLIGQAIVPDGVGPAIGGVRPLAGFEMAAIVRYTSGLPFTRTNATGDTLIGLPNSFRLPPQTTADVLVRRPLRLWGRTGSLYLDVRNALNARTVEAVRRDTGEPGLGDQALQQAANQAYAAHPEPIPYESPRYRAGADLNNDGMVAGSAELLPMYLAAARDFNQPLFAYGAPRLVRLGVEFVF